MKKNNGIKILGLIIIVIVSIIGLYSLKSYLKRENLLIYANGTNHKAFLNATWEMSAKEVERANHCNLVEETIPPLDLIVGELSTLFDKERIVRKESNSVLIWDGRREIFYDFFDDRLFRVRIHGNVWNKERIDNSITSTLEAKYGQIKRNQEDEFSGRFITDLVDVNYYQFEYNDSENKNVQHFQIEFTYKPLYNEIINITSNEIKNIF